MKVMCVECNIYLKDEDILKRHSQYWHGVDNGLPVCTFKTCKNRPSCNDRTRCRRHCTPETNIKLLTVVQCKKIKRKPRIIHVEKMPKIDDTFDKIIHDLNELGI